MSQPPRHPQGDPNQNWQGQPQQGGFPQNNQGPQGGFGQQGYGPEGGYQQNQGSQGGYPQQGYGPQGYQQGGYQQQAPQKKKGGCFKIGLIALGALLLLGIIIAAVSGGDDSPTVSSGDKDSSQSAGSGSDEGQEESVGAGVEFKGKTDKDTSANGGETITQKGIAITSTPLAATVVNEYLPPQVCTTITIKNDGVKQQSFNTFDWKMQDPNGTAKSSSFMSPDGSPALDFGEIAPGGQTEGDICFEGDPSSAPGEYVVLYQGNVFLSDRLAWVNQL